MTTLYQVVNGGSDSAADINQIIQALTGVLLVNPGPMVQVSTQTINTNVASVTFNNIPAYNSLYVAYNARSSNVSSTTDIMMRINGNSGANYYDQRMGAFGTTVYGNGTSGATAMRIGTITAASVPAVNMGSGFLNLAGWGNLNLVNTIGFSMFVTNSGIGNMECDLTCGQYAISGTAFTSITLFPLAGNFNGGASTNYFTIYGSM